MGLKEAAGAFVMVAGFQTAIALILHIILRLSAFDSAYSSFAIWIFFLGMIIDIAGK